MAASNPSSTRSTQRGGELQIHLQLGITVEKSGQQRHQPVVAKTEGGGDAQPSGRLGQQVLGE